jgi:hypothetical protein
LNGKAIQNVRREYEGEVEDGRSKGEKSQKKVHWDGEEKVDHPV